MESDHGGLLQAIAAEEQRGAAAALAHVLAKALASAAVVLLHHRIHDTARPKHHCAFADAAASDETAALGPQQRLSIELCIQSTSSATLYLCPQHRPRESWAQNGQIFREKGAFIAKCGI
eukprot:scaffold2245_cov232-Pinguiococcus_pyrenoidosus.AAC.7